MSTVDERLYQLLPAIYRLRDADNGEPLRALLAVMQQELGLLEADIANLYESWFIETCPEWVVPYIGDLLGVRGLFPVDDNQLSLRPYVGNTIGYRRRKGTASMLEGLARDATGGWPAAAVEYFQLLATTQNLNHIRWRDLRTPDLRDTSALELLGGPFERAARFAEVRRIAVERGRYNIRNVGIFLWRLLAIAEAGAPATADASGATNFRFDQLGLDAPLFGKGRPDAGTTRRVQEADVPGPLRARALADELDAIRAAEVAGDPPPYDYFAPGQEVFLVEWFDATVSDPKKQWTEVPADRIQICDLSTWRIPTPLTFTPAGGTLTSCQLSVDPQSGRMIFLDGPKSAVRVWYQHGLATTLGGGGYSRPIAPPTAPPTAIVAVTAATPPVTIDPALDQAIAAWNGAADVIFEIQDSAAYSLGAFTVPAGRSVTIAAKNTERPTLHLPATLQVTLADEAQLTCDGLLLADGGIELLPTQAAPTADHRVTFTHCTLVPGQKLDAAGNPIGPAAREAASVSISSATNAAGLLTLALDHCIAGRLALAGAPTVELTISDSIVDGTGGTSDAIAGADQTSLTRVTVLGTLSTRTLFASDSILDGLITCERTQVGCLRFSYVGRDDAAMVDSITPRKYRCQPDLAIAAADPSRELDVRERLLPLFASRTFGQPHYAQLANNCAAELRTGASDGSEMGAFAGVHQPQRLANLKTALDEYLRLGLEAGVFFVT